jgi:hypothetical protein
MGDTRRVNPDEPKPEYSLDPGYAEDAEPDVICHLSHGNALVRCQKAGVVAITFKALPERGEIFLCQEHYDQVMTAPYVTIRPLTESFVPKARDKPLDAA